METVPSDLLLEKKEVIIAVGLKCVPSGLQSDTPVKITLPHSAIFTNPKKASITLYTRNHGKSTECQR